MMDFDQLQDINQDCPVVVLRNLRRCGRDQARNKSYSRDTKEDYKVVAYNIHKSSNIGDNDFLQNVKASTAGTEKYKERND